MKPRTGPWWVYTAGLGWRKVSDEDEQTALLKNFQADKLNLVLNDYDDCNHRVRARAWKLLHRLPKSGPLFAKNPGKI
jgi:hypothetical protein